jgi:hypothetical protein
MPHAPQQFHFISHYFDDSDATARLPQAVTARPTDADRLAITTPREGRHSGRRARDRQVKISPQRDGDSLLADYFISFDVKQEKRAARRFL